MKNFVNSPYDYDYSEVNNEEISDEEAAIVIETDQSKLVSNTAADESKLIKTDSCSEEEEDLHADVIFNEPIDQLTWPLINFLFLK